MAATRPDQPVVIDALSKTTLSLQEYGKIGDKGFIALANELVGNSSITSLNLSSSNLFNSFLHSGTAFKALVNLMRTNTTITHLNISNNYLNRKQVDKLLQALENNYTLLQLDLSQQYTETKIYKQHYMDGGEAYDCFGDILSDAQKDKLNTLLKRNADMLARRDSVLAWVSAKGEDDYDWSIPESKSIVDVSIFNPVFNATTAPSSVPVATRNEGSAPASLIG